MAFWGNIAGTVTGYLRLGLSGVRLKNDAGVLAVRNAGDTAGASLSASGITTTADVGIRTSSPAYNLDIRNTTTNSQVHISGQGADSGLYLTSAGSANGFMSMGSAYSGALWVAKSTAASVIGGGSGAFLFYTNTGLIAGDTYTPTSRMIILATGEVGVRTITPTAALHIGAGVAAVNGAPLKLTAGTNLTTPESGAFEFDGTNLYFTVAGVRKTVTLT